MHYLKCVCGSIFQKGTDNMPHCRVSLRRYEHASLLIFFFHILPDFHFLLPVFSFPLSLSVAPSSISLPPPSLCYIRTNIHFVLKRENMYLTDIHCHSVPLLQEPFANFVYTNIATLSGAFRVVPAVVYK